MGEIVAIATVVASAVSTVTSIAGGIGAKAAADRDADQYREEQENARVAGLQEETERRRELQRQLASVDAIRGGRGVELYSPTADNIRSELERAASEDINTIRLNASNRARRYGAAADASKSQGTGALISGIGQGLSSAGRAAEKVDSMANRPSRN